MTHKCPSCGCELGSVQLSGKCKHCGASYRATSVSKLWLYGAVFVGVLFGPMFLVPMLASNGLDPSSVIGIAMGAIGSITAVLFLGALSLRMLKFEKG